MAAAAESTELDPRIKIELENLNSATDEINKLEIELEEANSTFRILLNESTRRLKLSSKKLGSCIEKARPYYEALEKAREAQIECQKAAVKFQRANEIHAAAKETVALAEQRFMSNSHEWQFDNAWQEMLNHATQKVMDAEKQKAECHEEHQQRAMVFSTAEQTVQQLEERFRRSINKSRPYFEEKQICNDQLLTQKERIHELQQQVQTAKNTYATALRNLERISEDIHRQRGDFQQMGAPPPGPREPGVGAELNSPTTTTLPPLPDFQLELEKCDYPSIAGSQISLSGNSHRSSDLASVSTQPASMSHSVGGDESETEECEADYADSAELNGVVDERDLEELRQKVKILAVRPIEGGDGEQQRNDMWEHELTATVNKLDQLMLMNECALKQQKQLKMKQQQQQQQKQPERQMTGAGVRPVSLGAEAPAQMYDIVHAKPAAVVEEIDEDDVDVVVVTGKAGPLVQITHAKQPEPQVDAGVVSYPATPEHTVQPLKKLQQKLGPLPTVNVSMRELPLLARLSNEILDRTTSNNRVRQLRRRSLD
ncbi:SH3 domain-binding protein 5 homolog [Bactrocera dorsalis]|uniref:SH3 domain-binding protein 5 homolog n=2 Tax=Bactrocera dorsalis TaxID=27457 RepID=A0A6I9ULA3_BACDO|nr:SH3 domain-binding protein 5 homolog [Bactrocera dorsalis]